MYQALFHKIHLSGANLLIISLSNLLEKVKNPSENEREAHLEKRSFRYYMNPKRTSELVQYYSDYPDPDDMLQVFDFRLARMNLIQKNGIVVLADTASKYYNVVNGYRVTTDTPENYTNSIYVFGNCNAVGFFAEDKDTVASQLQRMFNAALPNEFAVVNAANWSNFETTCRQIISPLYSFKKNDFVIIIENDADVQKCDSVLKNFHDKSFYTYFDLSHAFDRPHTHGEILLDSLHMTRRGYAVIADFLFQNIAGIKKAREGQRPSVPQNLAPYMNYLAMLKKKRGRTDGVIGSLVMNCNPFTLGHKHLVTEALKRCDYLYIFILDEDKSFFTFDDRIAMVKLGLHGVAHVSVIPSGKTIISSETMPEYFDKDSMQDVRIDTSYDLNLFSLIIAPALDITKRFAGHEPFCNITRQYNDGMRKTLPQHGIEFIELPRHAIDGREVSASAVREHMKNNDHASIKRIVPQSTYDFLIEKNYLQAAASSE